MNGFPILPPLITNDVTTEIQYYKQLAIAVEERLIDLEIAKKTILKKDKQKINKPSNTVPVKDDDIATDFTFKSKSNHIKLNMTSINEVILDYPTKDNTKKNLIDVSTSANEKTNSYNLIETDIISETKYKNLEQADKSRFDNAKSCLNETMLYNSSSSDTITISTDLNQYLNTSVSIRTDTTNTTPENWKPQVPKTLDIVPITVDVLNSSDKTILLDEKTPKLIRKDSYVLDAPSPMLLALMKTDLTNREINRSTSTQQLVKCQEWNTNQMKTNFENHFKEATSFRSNSVSKFRKGNHSNIPSQRVCKSVSNSKTCSPLDVYKTTKSVDCIQAMLMKEFYSSKTVNSKPSNQSKIYSLPINSTNNIRNHSSKKTFKNTSILNLANKLSRSLGSLSSGSSKSLTKVEKKNNNPNTKKKCIKSNDSNILPKKKRLIITSEKIVADFKKIQDIHKKQMIELITRQQKEQIIMQENFKKQQIFLLAQIRKAFPEISIPALSEAISGKSAEHSNNTPLNSKTVNKRSDSINKPQINRINYYEKDEHTISKSPIDYIHKSKELSSTSCHLTIQTTPTVCSFYQSNSHSTQIFNNSSILNSHMQIANIKAIDDIPVGSPICKHSNVSRQLFPLDNKTVRVPLLDNSVYTEKHIKAAIIINAYAKGFLVRRLMKTEKIIALKNTYKEALHCMLRLHVDEPLQVPEIRFKKRLQQQCDAASMNIVDLFSQNPAKQMEIIAHDREIKIARSDRPSSARSYSFATQCTLARKKFKKTGLCPNIQISVMSKSYPVRKRCQTWTSNSKEKKITTSLITQGIKRSTSAGTVRKPWR